MGGGGDWIEGFREGDEGIREWGSGDKGGELEGGEGKLREGWRQGAVREEWHWRGMRGREEEDCGTSHHWYKQHKCREVIYHWQCSQSSLALTTPLPRADLDILIWGGGVVQWQIQKFDENPSTSRGVWGHAPQEILTYSCSETASGAIWGKYFASNSTRNFGG